MTKSTLQQTDYKQLREAEAKVAVEALSKFANTFGDTEAFVSALMREHRTLQQSIFGLFLASIQQWSKEADISTKEFGFDLRNEWTVERSAEIVVALGNALRPPLI